MPYRNYLHRNPEKEGRFGIEWNGNAETETNMNGLSVKENSTKDLTSHVAVVTGAGRGIGRAVALQLAAMGATVILLARDRTALDEVKQQIESSGGSAESLEVAFGGRHLRREAACFAFEGGKGFFGLGSLIAGLGGLLEQLNGLTATSLQLLLGEPDGLRGISYLSLIHI